jgi:divinyl chlorophyllide a 8-vinyl-reductase
LFPDVEQRLGDVTDQISIARDGFRGEEFDVHVSCLASRTGVPEDAWAIEYRATAAALRLARDAGIDHMVLLSAICVQRPRLAFQEAKLAMERELIASGLTYSIVRPTAFFKSLTGQVARVQRGKPYLVFGDGRLTSCKPISDGDLGRYIAGCLDDPSHWNAVLPIGGPGPAITPREQAEHLFYVLGQEPRIRQIPVGLLSWIARLLAGFGRVNRGLAEKAALARIGHYYATQSMLVLDPETGCYEADLTPSTGTETLFDFQERLVRGEVSAERGDHAVFQ